MSTSESQGAAFEAALSDAAGEAAAGTARAAAEPTMAAEPTVAAAPHPLAYLYPVSFFSGTILISLGPILDPILRDLGIPLAQAGLLAAGFAGGRVLGLAVLNLALARVSLKRMVVGAALVQAVGLGLGALVVNSLWPLLLALAAVGGAATVPLVVPAIWMGAYAKRTTERAMLLVLIFFALGVVSTPLVIGAVLGLGAGWRWVFAGEAVFSLLMAGLYAILPLADVSGRENLRLRHLRQIAKLDPRLLSVVLGAMFLYIGAEHIMNIWLSEFQIQTFGASQGAAALALAFFFGGMMAGRLVALPLTKRVIAARMIAISCGLLAVFALVTAFSPNFVASEGCIFLAGLGASVSYPLISSYINRFPVKFSGLVFSLITISVIVSQALFAYVVGPAAESLGMRPGLALAAVPAVAVALLSRLLPRSNPAVEKH